MSPYFPNCMGYDGHSESDVLLLNYEHIEAESVHNLLSLSGQPLEEDCCLFRFWARELLHALIHLDERSTYRLPSDLSLENIMIAGPDDRCQLLLGNLDWGSAVAPWDTYVRAPLNTK